MCGIVGMIGRRPVASLLLEGLKRLEYRGYDSAGIATLDKGEVHRCRAQGKLINLSDKLVETPLNGTIGIGHTRWATHGQPNEVNAHPHATEEVAVVHNGIIENFQELRAELEAAGCVFQTETDTETVAHLLTVLLKKGLNPQEAVAKALHKLDGAFALGIIFKGHDNLLIAARRGSPLAIGYGTDGEMFLGSDAMALAPFTNRVSYLEEGDWAILTPEGATIYDENDAEVSREIQQSQTTSEMIGKGKYRHFMLKEIHEQSAVIGDTLRSFVNTKSHSLNMPKFPFDLSEIDRITIVACGTAYYAGAVAKYWFEKYARLPVEIDFASEFRYREGPLTPHGVSIFVSQSGETADTLAALRYAKSQNQHIVSVVNVAESSIARESDVVLPTLAGPEIGVASTKAFTTQLVALACFVLEAAKAKGLLSDEQVVEMVKSLEDVSVKIKDVLAQSDDILKMAHDVAEARDVIYLGRGTSFPLALEGALKLKEISYIHAEGFAAGEMKHGSIALVDEFVPIVVIAPAGDTLFEKTLSNVQESIARGGRVLLLSNKEGCARLEGEAEHTFEMPEVDPFTAPILYAVPVQLLAYHSAVLKGTDVDQPRNLAKSVTVE